MSSKINLGLPKFILKMGNPTTRYVYEFGDFRLDACHRMLYHGDEELSLAPKAVVTLVALVERRGEIMSKDELLEAVWPDAVVEESNLFVYISVLRKTLGTQERRSVGRDASAQRIQIQRRCQASAGAKRRERNTGYQNCGSPTRSRNIRCPGDLTGERAA